MAVPPFASSSHRSRHRVYPKRSCRNATLCSRLVLALPGTRVTLGRPRKMRSVMNLVRIAAVTFVVASAVLLAQPDGTSWITPTIAEVDRIYPDIEALYLDLHRNPELAFQETQTAAKLAARVKALGFDVTTGVGRTGIVAVMKNGPGPTVMLRTELDALPVEERTGLPFASKIHTKDDAGHEVPVMHACGHDLHMASLMGTATIMANTKNTWHGTLMLIGQPAEETITGAKKMIDDGLFTRFPKPDVAVALHTSNELPTGKVGVASGYRYANADSVRITIFGKGGHGSAPHTTVDPIVIAARTILALQTITSREVKPGETAVILVGYIHAGKKNNIIPDQAELGLTVRTYKPEVRKQVFSAIERISKAESAAAGASREPSIEHYESTDAVYNDPPLAQRLRSALE